MRMTMMASCREMAVDIETYSSVDIDVGVYAYSEAPDFEIILVAYKMSDDPEVKCFMPRRFASRPGVLKIAETDQGQLSFLNPDQGDFQLDGDEDFFLQMLQDPEVICTAYNANFERTCLSGYYGIRCDPDQWRCTAVLASTLGLPRSLAGAGDALGLSEDEKKLKTGKALIQYFCKPCAPTKANGGRTRNLPRHDMEKWKLFCQYNRQDVVTEQAIRDRLIKYKPIPAEQKLWSVDQIICDRGIRIDRPFVEKIVKYDENRQQALKEEAQQITGLTNPNSIIQLKTWLSSHGAQDLAGDLSKQTVDWALGYYKDPDVIRILQIRKALGKTSTKKYTAMLESVCHDDRVRGMLQFYGANRTGRWTGRIVQLQNLPRNMIPDLGLARSLVAEGDFEGLELLYGEPAQIFSELVRTAFIPSEGNRFVVTDFSAIEARVIAWLADETWRLDTFRNGGDIYCESASRMFGVPVEKHGQNAHLRQQGKIAELALGYGGGAGAIKAMDSKDVIPEARVQPIIDQWRAASPNIVKLWRQLDKAAKTAITEKRSIMVKHGIAFYFQDGILFARLPSGRSIAYWGARIGEGTYGDEIMYYGVGQTSHKWGLLKTYGGKITENLVQATARDCLAAKMIEATDRGYEIVAHVHDEMIIDVPRADQSAAQDIDALMAEPIDWAPGLPLKGGTYECDYYMKD
jgi:DNA polymerase